MAFLGYMVKWKLVSIYFEIELISTRDRCTVFTESAIGSEHILGTPDGTPRGRGSCGISFSPFGDGVSIRAR